jgi:hypothetical protein
MLLMKIEATQLTQFTILEKGFYYEPAGIGSGWILWEDIAEGVGDILLRPSDFGDDYEKVLGLFKSKCKFTIDYHKMA